MNNLFQDCEKVTLQHYQMQLVHKWLVNLFAKQILLEHLNLEHLYQTALP